MKFQFRSASRAQWKRRQAERTLAHVKQVRADVAKEKQKSGQTGRSALPN